MCEREPSLFCCFAPLRSVAVNVFYTLMMHFNQVKTFVTSSMAVIFVN